MALYMGKYCTNQYFDISYLKKLTSQNASNLLKKNTKRHFELKSIQFFMV